MRINYWNGEQIWHEQTFELPWNNIIRDAFKNTYGIKHQKISCIIFTVYWEQGIASLGFMFDKYIDKQAINGVAEEKNA